MRARHDRRRRRAGEPRDEVHAEAVGVIDLETGAPMRRDTIFRIASMSKPITAAAA